MCFTDVLLKAGARQVYAVDVGYGQLAWTLRQDPRVVNLERTHIRDLNSGDWANKPTLAVIDVSFISLLQVLPHALPHLAPKAWLYVLIKPQFEVGRKGLGKRGRVRSEQDRLDAIDAIRSFSMNLGFSYINGQDSGVAGARSGNIEHFMHLRRKT